MTSKFTPGPWETDKGSVHGWTVYGPAVDEYADPGELAVIAEGMREGDAHLIAAAPDLLLAVKALLHGDDAKKARALAEAAVARAEGRK